MVPALYAATYTTIGIQSKFLQIYKTNNLAIIFILVVREPERTNFLFDFREFIFYFELFKTKFTDEHFF